MRFNYRKERLNTELTKDSQSSIQSQNQDSL